MYERKLVTPHIICPGESSQMVGMFCAQLPSVGDILSKQGADTWWAEEADRVAPWLLSLCHSDTHVPVQPFLLPEIPTASTNFKG